MFCSHASYWLHSLCSCLSCFLCCLSLELYKHLGSVWGLSFCICTNVTKQDPDTKGQKWCSAVGRLGRGRKQKQKHFEEGALNLPIAFGVWGLRVLKLGFGGSLGHRDLVAWRKEKQSSQCGAKFWDKCRA